MPERRYQVVVNESGQFSVWPTDAESPDGWSNGGFSGSKQDCLKFIGDVWLDMAPAAVNREG